MTGVKLPAIITNTMPALDQLTTALGVPRDILASAGEIETAWNNLPGVLTRKAVSPTGKPSQTERIDLIDTRIFPCCTYSGRAKI